MIYFTKLALEKIKKKFYKLKSDNEGNRSIVYLRDTNIAKGELKKEKYTKIYSMYSLTGKGKELEKEKNVYLVGINNASDFVKKIYKILVYERLNILVVKKNSKYNVLFFDDSQIGKYDGIKVEGNQWPIALAKDDQKTVSFLNKYLKSDCELSTIIDQLKEIRITRRD